MPQRLFQLYQRKRIININVNIVAAGLAALLPTALVAHIAETMWPELSNLMISIVAVGADIFFDVMIFFGLHWVANHWRPFKGKTDTERMALSAKPPPYMLDAAMLQIERAIFSPLYYITAAGLTLLLQRQGMGAGFAVLIAFPTGMLVARVAHTTWGLRSGRFLDHDERERRRAAIEAGRTAATPPGTPAPPTAAEGEGKGHGRPHARSTGPSQASSGSDAA